MGNINPNFNDRVRYTIQSKNEGELVILEPIGWTTDEKEYSRNETYHGIVAKFSNSLTFSGDAAERIDFILDFHGINEDVKLKREERHPKTDVWTLTYIGYLDLSTWNKKKNQISLKFNSGGLEQILKAREGEKIEIDRATTLDGKALPDLKTVQVEMEGRRIFLKTKFTIKPTANSVELYNQTNGQTRGTTISLPLFLDQKSHENAQQPLEGTLVGGDTWERTDPGTTGNMFFAVSDLDRVFRLNFTFKFKVDVLDFDDINFFTFFFRLAKYTGGSDYILKENRFLFTEGSRRQLNGKTFSITFDETVTLLAGESLGLLFDQNMDGKNGKSAHLRININSIEGNLFIEENSFFESSQTKSVLAHDLADRLLSIATNQEGAFYSEFLGRTDIGYSKDGKGALTGFSHGFWIRGFDRFPIPSEFPYVSNLFKPLTTSFKDFVTSMEAVWNVGIGIETIGNKERVRMEELEYFYNKNVTIRLPNQVKEVSRKIATNLYFSGIEIGYEGGGSYEEANGLDEPNGKSTFTTAITKIKNVYRKLSPFRADTYGIEFERRQPRTDNDTLDRAADNDIFLHDLKRGFLPFVFNQRKWNDDFEKQPTGIFSPETATNLRFSPVNCLLRHGWRISGCLNAYLDKLINYGSSSANSQLTTKLIGGLEYSENKDILNAELEKARFLPIEIEFEHICDFEIMQMVEGNSVILGKTIPNFYGLVEFINENKEIEKGFLMNLKPNGKGKWTILKLNR